MFKSFQLFLGLSNQIQIPFFIAEYIRVVCSRSIHFLLLLITNILIPLDEFERLFQRLSRLKWRLYKRLMILLFVLTTFNIYLQLFLIIFIGYVEFICFILVFEIRDKFVSISQLLQLVLFLVTHSNFEKLILNLIQ